MKIAVVGTGDVGSSNAILFSQHHEVVCLEINPERVDSINRKASPIVDSEIEEYLQFKNLNLKATLNKDEAYKSADFLIIATLTDYDETINYFNSGSVEEAVQDVLEINPNSVMVIQFTITVRFVVELRKKLNCENNIFFP